MSTMMWNVSADKQFPASSKLTGRCWQLCILQSGKEIVVLYLTKIGAPVSWDICHVVGVYSTAVPSFILTYTQTYSYPPKGSVPPLIYQNARALQSRFSSFITRASLVRIFWWSWEKEYESTGKQHEDLTQSSLHPGTLLVAQKQEDTTHPMAVMLVKPSSWTEPNLDLLHGL